MKRKAILTRILALAFVSMLIPSLAIRPVVSQPGLRGPEIDKVSWRVVRSPAAQLVDMTAGPPRGTDIWTSSIKQPWPLTEAKQSLVNGGMRPSDIETMYHMGRTLSSREGLHMGFFGFNYRKPPLDDANFRHALAHLVPKVLIKELFFRYTAVVLNTIVPPTQPSHNPNVDQHPFSPGEAIRILTVSGRYARAPDGHWTHADGRELETLRLSSPREVVAPISYRICEIFIKEGQAIGLRNIVHVPMDFCEHVYMVMNLWDFEIFWMCHTLSRFPTQLYTQTNTQNNFMGSANPHGITTPGVIIDDPATPGIIESADYYSNVVWEALDPSAMYYVAAMKCQELIMGGSITDPLLAPAQNTVTDNRTMAIPMIPVYWRIGFDAQHQYLRGAVNMFGYGIHNMWTWMNIHWNTLGGYRPGTTVREVWPIVADFPEKLNPTIADTVYAWTFMDPVFDGLIAINPTNYRYESWLAFEWSFGAAPGGMFVTFHLNLTDSQGQPITWQDGKPISAFDIKFAWDFLWYWQVPRYRAIFRFYDPEHTVIEDQDTITARMTIASPWLAYGLAGTAYLLPPQVWSNNPVTNAQWNSMSEILSFDPSVHLYPLPGNYVEGFWPGPYGPQLLPKTWDDPGPLALPTQLFGTGPFKLQHGTQWILRYLFGDLNANRNYWLFTSEIQNMKADMFHRSGDVTIDGEIDVMDLAIIGSNMWSSGPNGDITGPIAPVPGPWPRPLKDGEVNSLDLAMAGKYYAETRHVPWP